MNQRALIRAQLASVRADLAEALPHLSDDLLEWAPAEGMRTVHGQLVEIIATECSMRDRITRAPRRTFEELEAPAWATTSVAGLVDLLDATRSETLEVLEPLSEEALAQPVEVHTNFAEYLGLDPVPLGELFRFIARHESYHTGQLISYLWARGDDPYRWV